MAAEKRYYWLKLKEGFFDDKAIKKLRRIAGGDTYIIIYFKLMLASLKNEGYIYYDGIEDDLYKEVALELDEDEDNVKFTLLYLEQFGMLEYVSADKTLLTHVGSLIGSETSKAALMRNKRKRDKEALGGNNVTAQLPPVTFCYTELDIEHKSTDIYTTTTTARAHACAKDIPTLTEVYVYFRNNCDKDANIEAEKFHAYNANRGWDCLPDWQSTADLWISRISEYEN